MENEIGNMPQAPITEEPQSGTPKSQKILYVIISVLVLILAVGAFYWFKGRKETTSDTQRPITESDILLENKDENLDEMIDQISDDFLSVTWASKAIIQPDRDPSCPDCIKSYLVGVVSEGEFEGQKLYLEIEEGLGLSFRYYILENGQPKYFSETVKLKGIDDLPETIKLAGTNYTLEKRYRSQFFSDIKIVRKMFTDPKVGDVWLTEEGCLVVKLPDQTAVAYDLVIPFANSENGAITATFTNGQKNSDSYQFNHVMGCGMLCYYLAYVEESELNPSQRLMLAGKTGNNEDIYVLKDPNDPVLKEIYNDKNTVAYRTEEGQEQPTNKYTYQQFINYRPLMYWKDPLGRWIEFKNQRFIMAAEMCKPVIYLYPTETTKLSVKVNPNGGFTYTNPPYDSGWLVEANPNGRIKDLKTNQMYDYLFWEGVGMNYPTDNKGWVISKNNLRAFFDQMLPTLGLQGQEIVDFKDYWVNRLKEKPYYHLTFIKKTQFDEIAPLDIKPVQPNSVIRVMMTAEGLDEYKKVTPQQLEAPDSRNGFTLVEWGGVVLR